MEQRPVYAPYPNSQNVPPSGNPYMDYLAQQHDQAMRRYQQQIQAYQQYQQPQGQMPQQPYQNPQQNIQQATNQQSFGGLYGRIVNTPNEIGVGEVLMDGNRYFFPSVDGSCIHVKHWTNTGDLKTQVYIPYVEPTPEASNESANDPFMQINARLDSIEQAIMGLSGDKPVATANRAKKGAPAE